MCEGKQNLHQTPISDNSTLYMHIIFFLQIPARLVLKKHPFSISLLMHINVSHTSKRRISRQRRIDRNWIGTPNQHHPQVLLSGVVKPGPIWEYCHKEKNGEQSPPSHSHQNYLTNRSMVKPFNNDFSLLPFSHLCGTIPQMLSHDKDSPGDLHRYLVVLLRGWLFLGIFLFRQNCWQYLVMGSMYI